MAANGAGMSIIKDSIYTGTGIRFDGNEATTNGGAVFATALSLFICNSCEFTNNKATKGGALYVDANSQTEITLSNFHRNVATENGSAFYIISSKTYPMSFIKKCNFTYNQVENFGSIFLNEASLELDQIRLENNLTHGQTSGIALIMS